MTYNPLLTGPLLRETAAELLVGRSGRPVGGADAADAGDYDNRNWDATVNCTCEQVRGDLTRSLDIHVPDDHPVRPVERGSAVALADGLGQPVLFPAAEHLPSAYWPAAPGGLLTRACLYESDEEDASSSIDAVAGAEGVGDGVPEDDAREVPSSHGSEAPLCVIPRGVPDLPRQSPTGTFGPGRPQSFW